MLQLLLYCVFGEGPAGEPRCVLAAYLGLRVRVRVVVALTVRERVLARLRLRVALPLRLGDRDGST